MFTQYNAVCGQVVLPFVRQGSGIKQVSNLLINPEMEKNKMWKNLFDNALDYVMNKYAVKQLNPAQITSIAK